MSSPVSVTQLLIAWSQGDRLARERLLPIVYEEVHQLAARYLRLERPNHTLQPTALVHEVYLRLVRQDEVHWEGRAQFFGLCARIVRQILVDYARKRRRTIGGGASPVVTLDEALVYAPERAKELLALDEALNLLGRLDERKSHVVELRYFGGLSNAEIASVLGISENTVMRDWVFARAWLQRSLAADGAVRPDAQRGVSERSEKTQENESDRNSPV